MNILSLFSGGLDSVAYTSKFVKEGHRVEAMAINYGQKNYMELGAAHLLAKKLKIPISVLDITSMSALWNHTQMLKGGETTTEYDPSIIVPLRNGIFLMCAMSYAYSNKFDAVVLGAQCDSIKQYWHRDHSETRFPDESPLFLSLMEKAANRGVFECQGLVKIFAPVLKGLDKADLCTIGYQNLGEIIFDTWTCRSDEEKQCGLCEACKGRIEAFKKAGIKDHTDYVE